MKKLFFLIISYLFAEPFEGLTLFTPYYSSGSTTFLINNNQEVVHTWEHERGPASIPYLMQDSTIIYPYKTENPTMEAGGMGGGIQKLTWDGQVLWDYTIADNNYQHHHDICPLPNNNILIIVWERKTAGQAHDKGRQEIDNPLNEMWVPAILELNPVTGNFDWEWHLWDHLVQDIDSTFDNYGIISEHPESMDINFGLIGDGGVNADWMHINSIDYNLSLDQIIFSSRNMNEIYIIDHSTTIEEASTDSGGNSNMGGGLLYRWGNPQVYQRGTFNDQKLFGQHAVNWIEYNYINGGEIILFNNGHGRPGGNFSSVDIINPPTNESAGYNIFQNDAFGPSELSWTFNGGQSFFSFRQSSAFRLENGNTIITVNSDNQIFEVDINGVLMWDYYLNDNSLGIPRGMKYSLNYFNLNGDLNCDGVINIVDIIFVVNIILGEHDNLESADLNLDGIVNILDILQLVYLILN